MEKKTAASAAAQARLAWLDSKEAKRINKKNKRVVLIGVLMGVAAMVAVVLDGVLRVEKQDKLCLVLDDDFSNGFNKTTWSHEIQSGGYGVGSFDWTTDSEKNAYVEDGKLYIVPTLTVENFWPPYFNMDGIKLDLAAGGNCTGDGDTNCAMMNNFAEGQMIQPIQSARITTKKSHSIRYGKVEVRARMPTGNWLWPAIWMMPRDSVYGIWPASGEIDLMESSGNMPRQRQDERSVGAVQSSYHFGPDWRTNAGDHHTGYQFRWRDYFNQGYHNYVLEWNEKRMRVYVDDPRNTMNTFEFPKEPMWDYGKFGEIQIEPPIHNPWIRSENPNHAPFDQDFYLILNVAVGGKYFQGAGDAPWTTESAYPATTFWNNIKKWYPTWPTDPRERGMAVDRVRMWQKC
ncbi:glycoside hydrolase [Pseudozyma hubeiensis SY62]|uniref:Glycoside hydrolase n=1 Tax=Pseudozyma hubeiensis (strain SY62) TaxID=1305764 RepID=R9NYH5_PSEHS|nr:glycoside hydrolase [Pseudozyma hubeiensis SY62]GAC93731.1 glycoside hydrolase [Pseudozyma hubeiensis SY62]